MYMIISSSSYIKKILFSYFRNYLWNSFATFFDKKKIVLKTKSENKHLSSEGDAYNIYLYKINVSKAREYA